MIRLVFSLSSTHCAGKGVVLKDGDVVLTDGGVILADEGAVLLGLVARLV